MRVWKPELNYHYYYGTQLIFKKQGKIIEKALDSTKSSTSYFNGPFTQKNSVTGSHSEQMVREETHLKMIQLSWYCCKMFL